VCDRRSRAPSGMIPIWRRVGRPQLT
jgi:hypothetical protein